MTNREATDIKKITPRKVGSYLMITLDEAQRLLKLADYEEDKRTLSRLILGIAVITLCPNEKSYFAVRPFPQTMISRKGLNWLAHRYGKPNDDFNKAVDMVFSKAKRA